MDCAFTESINEIIIKAAQSMPRQTYVENGVRYCAVCRQPVEIERDVFGVKRLLPIMCLCEREKERQRKETAKMESLAQARRKCFAGDYSRLAEAKIENAMIEHPKEAGIVQRYVDNFSQLYREQQGLIFYGNNGTGKSYLAAALCNALIENGHEAYFTTFANIDKQISGTLADKKTYLESLNNYALLVLDDLGAERKSEYMQELVFSVIDSRYASGKPMVITTNLTMQELKAPNTAQQSRIYDRILQICFPVAVDGESIRRKDTKQRYFEIKTLLGG